MKNTNAILYTAGAYGNLINWCCSYFSGIIPNSEIPFAPTGSVHNSFPGKFCILFPSHLDQYLKSENNFPIAQMHEYVLLKDDIPIESKRTFSILNDNLKKLVDNFKNIIFIYPTINSINCLINNIYFKIRTYDDLSREGIDADVWLRDNMKSDRMISLAKVYGIDKLRLELSYEIDNQNLLKWDHTSIDEFELWELRELSSKYFYDRTMLNIITDDEIIELKSKYPKVKFIELDQLRDNFEKTLLSILDTFEIKDINYNDVSKIYQQWLPTQIHLYKDQQINTIVTALINNLELDWTSYNISFFDEIFIQRKLFDNNIEIKCYNLNIFPTNAKDFQPLLERT